MVTSRQIGYIERLLKEKEFDFDEAITCATAGRVLSRGQGQTRHAPNENRCTPTYNLASRRL